MLAAASAAASAVRTAETTAKAARTEAAKLDDAYTIATLACEPETASTTAATAPIKADSSTRPRLSKSGEVSPAWKYFEKLPATEDADGKVTERVKCKVVRTLANGDKKTCEYTCVYVSSQGTKGLLR